MVKLAADALFDGYRFHPGAALLVQENGTIEGIVPLSEAGGEVQHLRGMLCPGFINAHCHLELSHLKGAIPEKTGLVKFLETVMLRRGDHTPERIMTAMENAEREMMEAGIVAVGDIANTPDSLQRKQERKLRWHTFVEAAGFLENGAKDRFRYAHELRERFAEPPGASVSLAPHAPYSVSRELFRLINDLPGNRLITIHNQESAAEDELFRKGTGSFFELYAALKMDASSFHPSGRSSLQTWLPYFSGNKKLILVHNTFTGVGDIRFAPGSSLELYWCLCPNANLYIEGRLPEINRLREAGCRIVVGTDSLASNHQLSILEELKTIAKHFPKIPADEMLRWATSNGAAALGMEDTLGSFEKGKMPGVLLIEGGTDGSLPGNNRVRRIL